MPTKRTASIVLYVGLLTVLVGCGSTTRTVTTTAKLTPGQVKEYAVQEATEKRAAAAQAKKEAREAAATDREVERRERAEHASEAKQEHATEALEASEQHAASEPADTKAQWASSTREQFIDAMVAAAPHGESAGRWRKIGECAIRELEGDYTEAEVGTSSFKTAEVQAGIRCGEQTP